MENNIKIPTLNEWMGGEDKFQELTKVFYEKVAKDEILEPVFRHMNANHAKHVADFLCESFGGAKNYTTVHGDNAMIHVIGKHLEKHLTENHRKQWMKLILESADEIGLPDDPEFRGVLVGHLEWGTRFAVIMSNEKENPMTTKDRIPQFGWGDFGGPFGYVEPIFRKNKSK
jgi:hemoglobin